MRKLLIVALGFGVIGGYGSAIARLSHRGSCGGGWGDGRYGYGNYNDWRRGYDRPDWDRHERERGPVEETRPQVAQPAPAPAPAAPVMPQIIIVQPQVQPAAPAPTIIVQPAAPAAAPAAPAPALKADKPAKTPAPE